MLLMFLVFFFNDKVQGQVSSSTYKIVEIQFSNTDGRYIM